MLLTAEIPRTRVLLSDFEEWHTVLNKSLAVPLLPGESDDEWSARFDVIHDEWWERTEPYHRLPLAGWPAPLRDELESSWALVFDLDDAGKRDLQGVVHELRASDVTRAVRIR